MAFAPAKFNQRDGSATAKLTRAPRTLSQHHNITSPPDNTLSIPSLLTSITKVDIATSTEFTMPTRGVFDFPELPLELQEMIYKYIYRDIDMSPLALLSRTGPELSIRATNRRFYNEAAKIYHSAHTRFRRARLMLLEKMWAEVGQMLEAFGAEEETPREDALWYAMTALTRAAHLNYEASFDTCSHYCRRFDSYYCNCLEHNKCFNCGRWLALAVYYDIRPELKAPRLIDPDGKHTALGQKLSLHEPQCWPDGDFLKSTKMTHRYPNLKDLRLFGQTWWRFEYHRQVFHLMSVNAQKCMGQGVSVPRKDMADLARWDLVLERNGIQLHGWKAEIDANGSPSWFERFCTAFGATSMRLVLFQFWSTH